MCSIWNKKIAAPFRASVNLVEYPDYTKFVKQPISLQEIRDNIMDFSYHTVEAFVNDLKLMVSNSSTYNGPQMVITQNARKLYEEAVRRLAVEGGGYVDKDVSHMGKDSYGFYGQENDIKTKFARIGRVFNLSGSELLDSAGLSTPDLPDVMNSHTTGHSNASSSTSTSISTTPAIPSPTATGTAEGVQNTAVNTSNLIPRRSETASASSSSVGQSHISAEEVEAGELPSSSLRGAGTAMSISSDTEQQKQGGLAPMSEGEEEEEEEEVLEEG